MAAKAADPIPGYIVLVNNDTVKCKFKTGGFILASNFFNKLTVINDQGEEQVYHASDKKLVAFGLTQNGRKYDYLYMDVKPKTDNGFYLRIVKGGKYQLYSHQVASSSGMFSSLSPIYVLYNPSGEFVKFEPCVLCPWKKHLRELLKDDQKALDEINNIPFPPNIPKFVVEINKE
ncbi:hypothetical protein [Segetibacter aerophilus]|uniref:Uncharacterized protein n=1 Tax=Segetibacter aerophilus TaxID=670293 RepID=A0A512BFH2_9BACT|nr:hypothetical protein [Segetibacter aerophilus]GEO10710.1 hypothetical protein SAE01_32060 [Segetibacter aerophilus]